MMLMHMIFSFLAAVSLAALFEIAYGTVDKNFDMRLAKSAACTLYYCFIALIWILNANVFWAFHLPALTGIALSHCDLCAKTSDPITWRAILKNVIPAAKTAFSKLIS